MAYVHGVSFDSTKSTAGISGTEHLRGRPPTLRMSLNSSRFSPGRSREDGAAKRFATAAALRWFKPIPGGQIVGSVAQLIEAARYKGAELLVRTQPDPHSALADTTSATVVQVKRSEGNRDCRKTLRHSPNIAGV